jgi:hypothetical protein
MSWLILVILATTAAALVVAAVAHRRRLPLHRLMALWCAGTGLYALGLAAAIEHDPFARALADLVPDATWYALGLSIVLVGVCVAVPLTRWLRSPSRPPDPAGAELDDGDGLLVEAPEVSHG